MIFTGLVRVALLSNDDHSDELLVDPCEPIEILF